MICLACALARRRRVSAPRKKTWVRSSTSTSRRPASHISADMFEHDARGSGFHTAGGALFWVSAQLTTISSQMPNPVTTPGRVLDILLEVWAISVVATAAASVAAFFHARHLEGHAMPRDA